MAESDETAEVEDQLANELLRIHRLSYGKGAGSAKVHYLDDTIILLLDDLELLPSEEFLVGAGEGNAVVEVRGRYQQAIETTFRAAVERATGRRVVSFASTTKLSPNWVAEIFRLGPPVPEFLRTRAMADDTTVPPEQRSYSPAATIANRMVRLYAKYLGRGPTKARTTLNTNIVLVVFGETMTRAEQNLVAAGEADAVHSMRRTLERAMRDEAVAAVEEIVGRKVTAYLTDIDTAANVAAVVFAIEPQPESGTVEVADAG